MVFVRGFIHIVLFLWIMDCQGFSFAGYLLLLAWSGHIRTEAGLPTANLSVRRVSKLVIDDPAFWEVSENRGPQYSTRNSRILIIRTPNKVTLFSKDSTH